MIYLLAPSVTKCNSAAATRFFSACELALQRHVPVTSLHQEAAFHFAPAGPSDTAILFNAEVETPLSKTVTDLLKATGNVFPVAMTKLSRKPSGVAATRQSFDVTEFIALRGGEISIDLAGASFARELLSIVQPGLTRAHLALFLSHRRTDGETLARDFWQKLVVLQQNSFRDLADLVMGESAQQVIEERLRASDAVLFFDTPEASTSEWVARELRIALRGGIPIVWIRAGGHSLANSFPHPAAQPHFVLTGTAVTSEDAEKAVSLAADLVRESAVQILDVEARLKALADVTVEERQRDKLIYTVRIQCGKGMPYPMECTTHLVQLFGTRPRPENFAELGAFPGKYTARMILVRGMTPNVPGSGDGVLAAGAEDYVECLEDYVQPAEKPKTRRGLIVSGAFPDGATPKDQQDIVNVVRAFAQRVLESGGTIIFGTHPTFVPLIVASAKETRSGDMDKAVRLYYSEEFVDDPASYKDHGTVIACHKAGSRNASLTLMRSRMISDEIAVGLVAIGGRLPRPGIVPGVDEEVDLARKRGLPVLLIGSVQGRSAQLAAEYASAGWKDAPNAFTPEENEQIRTSTDFAGLAASFLRRLGI